MDVKQLVNLIYIIAGVITFVVFDKMVLWVWPALENGANTLFRMMGAQGNLLHNWAIIGSYVTLTTLIALVLAGAAMVAAYQPDEYRSFLSEVVIELKKVTWPGADETRRSTLIVIVFTIVLSGFLWISDSVWRVVTDWILTPPT